MVTVTVTVWSFLVKCLEEIIWTLSPRSFSSVPKTASSVFCRGVPVDLFFDFCEFAADEWN